MKYLVWDLLIFVVLIAPMLWAAENSESYLAVLKSPINKLDNQSVDNPLTNNPNIKLNLNWGSKALLGSLDQGIIRLPPATGHQKTLVAGTKCAVSALGYGGDGGTSNLKPMRFDVDEANHVNNPANYIFDKSKSISYKNDSDGSMFLLTNTRKFGGKSFKLFIECRIPKNAPYVPTLKDLFAYINNSGSTAWAGNRIGLCDSLRTSNQCDEAARSKDSAYKNPKIESGGQ